MSAHQLLAHAEDFKAAAMRDRPEGMLQVVADAHQMPEVLQQLADAMRARYEAAEEQPIAPIIKEMYAAVHSASLAVVRYAEEIGPAIERIHEEALDRLRNPRKGEEMWDVAANRDMV